MVRLKAKQVVCLRPYFKNFNSNMVRLKVWRSQHMQHMLDQFQFQYGSIKSVQYEQEMNDKLLFQFQYGSIKRI